MKKLRWAIKETMQSTGKQMGKDPEKVLDSKSFGGVLDIRPERKIL
jgi:hypothetical protein